MVIFKLHSKFKPAGDQPRAIEQLLGGLASKREHQTLLGVTGSGKTFTIANVIERVQKPTLVIAHNKTLAAQLAQEYKEFFPENAVHYFVSYYDYYQPEAYMPVTDTYIEKDASINEEIERLRHASTQALLTRKDVIIVASVSCIYGLGSPEEYEKENQKLFVGQNIGRNELLRKLIAIFYTRTNADLTSGTFRALGSSVEIMPVSETSIYQLEFEAGTIARIRKIDPISRALIAEVESVFLFPAKHFITTKAEQKRAVTSIKKELNERIKYFDKEGKLLEADRIKRRTSYDLAMIKEVGYCSGIENYSRHLSGRAPGSAPETLLSYFGKDFLTVIDESHVTMPQISGMFAGDESRKRVLIEHGFRLPSALDNRPLRFAEFEERVGQVIYTSATPGKYEIQKATDSGGIVEQVIRPTGLIDPEIELRPIVERGNYKGQIHDLIGECEKVITRGFRVIATTLTKKMAEDLSSYLKERKIKAEYLHSEIKTLERIKILREFRQGKFDVIVGVNLLREGLDLPEVALIGILDADKEGFLRSETSLIQTIGRAARNLEGRVILYADRVTDSMKRAMDETNRRRAIQVAYNKEHGITPKSVEKKIHDIMENVEEARAKAASIVLALDKEMLTNNPLKLIKQKEKEMNSAVKVLDFETAAILRDEIKLLEQKLNQK
ncbi:MAG TPA: excinuclease ABC subunit UvrB [Candidatus Paceibacterota bacterium]